MNNRKTIALWKKGTGLILAFSLFMTSTAFGAGQEESEWYEPVYHANVHYSDMKYEGFDRTELDRLLEEMDMLCSSGETGHEEEIAELYEEILSQWDWLCTQCALISLEYSKDITNEEAQKIDQEMAALEIELKDKVLLVLKEASESPYGDVLKERMGDDAKQLEDYEPISDRQFELEEEDKRLTQSYDQAMFQTYTVQIDGEEWSTERYDKEPPEDEEKSARIEKALLEEKNKKVASVLQELIQVRNEIAKLNGYDNYADYAYEEIYARDFTTEDVKAVHKGVKEFVNPLVDDFLIAQNMINFDALDKAGEGKTGEDILNELGPFMELVHPELAEAFSYMRDYGLYDIEKSNTKQNRAFSKNIPSYGSPFIFNQPKESYRDYKTMIHEFGHYNQMFHETQSLLWQQFRSDVYEIHSQGLEVLFYPYAQELFGEGGEAFQYETVMEMLLTVVQTCLFDEFENRLYENPDMTIEEINGEFYKIAKEYGFDYSEDQAYTWISVPHTFHNPKYCIAYTTSALAALDIWMESLDNREEAVDQYMRLTALGGEEPFRKVMKEAGFHDIFQEGVIQEITEEIREIMKVDEKVAEYEKSLEQNKYVPMIAVILGAAVLGVIVVVIIKKKKKGELEDETKESETDGGNIHE